MISAAKGFVRENFFYEPRKFDIDPISVLAVAALHSLREKDTKYQFHPSGMYPQTPKDHKIAGMNYRWITRSAQDFYNKGGASSAAIDHIWAAYFKAVLLWEPKKEDSDPIYNLIRLAAAGVQSIKETTYPKESTLTGSGFTKWVRDMNALAIDKEEQTYLDVSNTMRKNRVLLEKIKSVWTIDEIGTLNKQIQFALEGKDHIGSITDLTARKFHRYQQIVNPEEVAAKEEEIYERAMIQSPKPARPSQPQRQRKGK